MEQKPLVLAYGTDDLRMTMINGSAALAPMYAGDAAYSMMDNPDLRYVIPREGANIFVDGMCKMCIRDRFKSIVGSGTLVCIRIRRARRARP